MTPYSDSRDTHVILASISQKIIDVASSNKNVMLKLGGISHPLLSPAHGLPGLNWLAL